MELFFLLLQKLAPLYVLVLLGWWSAHRFHVRKDSTANLLIYILLPIVIFQSVLRVNLNAGRLWLPLWIFILCSAACGIAWFFGKRVYPSPTRNLFAFASGNCNSGYFGFPVAFALYGEEGLGIAVLISMGFVIYENTLGYYVAARGNSSPLEAFKRVLKLPGIYAFACALLARRFGLHDLGPLEDISVQARGTYTILGMMLIGMGLADCRWKDFDLAFVGGCFVSKFLVWPAIAAVFLLCDQLFLHVLDPASRRSLWLTSALPMAGNVVAFAAALHIEPARAALAVFLSTMFGIVFIPLFLGLSQLFFSF